jgi:uncharacterized membrane protein
MHGKTMRSPLTLLLLIFATAVLLTLVQVGALTIAFGKLGLSGESALLLLLTSVIGSAINLPLFSMRAQAGSLEAAPETLRPLLEEAMRQFKGRTTVAVNVGGGLVPVCFSAYLMHHNPIPVFEVALSVAVVALICYRFSRPIPGLGIGMPMFVAPIAAALIALTLNEEASAPLAYICGTLGVLIGADLMRTSDIRRMGVPVASIGGAGTFDGIFLTGLVAVLLA